MQHHSTRRAGAVIGALAALGLASLAAAVGVAVAGDGPHPPELREARAATARYHSFQQAQRDGYAIALQSVSGASVNSSAREKGALAGTSETFTDMRQDGSYFDPSLGRRVSVAPSVTIVEPSAFDWGDAGVGAAGAFGLMLLASGLVIVSRHSHRSTA
jgi:hypothetical protein